MIRKTVMPVVIIVNLILVLTMTAAVPVPRSSLSAVTSEKSDLVSLEVVNNSSGYVYIWLNGPAFYYLWVKPGESKTYTVMRGEYTQDVSYCGARESSTIDLTKKTKLFMPVCGANTKQTPSSPHVVDITNTLKIVKVTLVNDADTRVLAILTGPSTYVFLLDVEAEKDYTIAKGDYEVLYYACGSNGVKGFSAYFNSVLKLKCPK